MSLGRSKECKYQCGTVLAWDTEENYFVEVENNNAQHTRERCMSLRGVDATVPTTTTTTASPRANVQVKEAVNSDLMMAVLQELRRANGYLAKIAGEEQ